MGLLLTLVALLLLFILAIPALLIGTVVSLLTHTGDRYYKNIAKAIDIFGNVLCQHLFNMALRKKEGYKFGAFGETISFVLGKNKQSNTLTGTGKFVALALNTIDKNHLEKSIN